MPYCTLSDLQKIVAAETLVNLTDKTNSGVVDQTVIDGAIAMADALIDSFASARYATPFLPVPQIVCDVAAIAAVYRLHVFAGDVPEEQQAAYDAQLAWLKLLNTGKVNVPAATEISPTSPTSFASATVIPPVMGRSELEGF